MADLLEPFAGDRAQAVAEKLLRHFGSLARALSADPDELAKALDGEAKTFSRLVAARRLIDYSMREQLGNRRVSPSDPAYRRHVQLLLAPLVRETLHATFVDTRQGYLTDEMMAEGSHTHVDGSGRRLLGRALALEARGIILAHNHPSGCAEPSADDLAATARIAALCRSVEIDLIDHLIVTQREVYSLRKGRYL